MTNNLWQKLQAELRVWRVGALPGVSAIALVSIVRLLGGLQPLELAAFDALMYRRPAEAIDKRILIVGIDEADIQRVRQYPIPDAQVAALIKTLQKHQPVAIGLDMFRDIPVEPGHRELAVLLKTQPNLYAIERIVPDQAGYTVSAPPLIARDRVGFSDSELDNDGYLRRSALGLYNASDDFRFSLALLLAETYLSNRGYELEAGIADQKAMRFGDTELLRFQPNTGSYIRAETGGVQTLLNFRSGPNPFRKVTLRQVLAGQVDPMWVRDRIVLVGITASSVKDVINSAAIPSQNPGLIDGVEAQAHAVSQILSAVLDQRPLLRTWSDGWEYLWIGWWGLIGMAIGRFGRSPWKGLLLLTGAGLGLLSLCYGLLIIGWWIPLIPPLLVLTINAVGPTAAQFYRYEQDLRTRLRDRQLLIEHTFNTIHNGPLQTIARMLRQTENTQTSAQLPADLHLLNQELRSLYETMRQEALSQDNSLRLGSNQAIDLQAPLHELLFQVYDSTLQREFPGFQTIKVKIVKFEPMSDRFLTIEQKRGLCRFLEEALCNVGRHALRPTRLNVTCAPDGANQVICVADNGAHSPLKNESISPKASGFGTQQAQNLAKQLRGTFRRYPQQPQGMVCEIVWTVRRFHFWLG
jgi:CHASE2 domain-containing sensor protein/two-component sensor histidine kinase